MTRGFFRLFLLILLLISCRHENKNNLKPSLHNDYAKFFELSKLKDGFLLKVKEPYPGARPQIIVLSQDTAHRPPSDTLFVTVPVKKFVATSVTHLQPLKELGVLDKLQGFTDTKYIADPEIIARVKRGEILDVGHANAMDMEKLLQLSPDLIFMFASGPEDQQDDLLKRHGITPVYVAEWMETHPLGRAEWIKFFGIFFGKEKQAVDIFEKIKNNYLRLFSGVSKTGRKPKIFQGGRFGDKWYVPGGRSWAAQLIRDAGGEYLIDNHETASTLLNNEQALLLLEQADIWFNPGTWQSMEQILKEFPQVKNIRVFNQNQIYSAYTRKNSAGKNEFFEKSVLHPEYLLDDYRKIFEQSPDTAFYFMQKLSGK